MSPSHDSQPNPPTRDDRGALIEPEDTIAAAFARGDKEALLRLYAKAKEENEREEIEERRRKRKRKRSVWDTDVEGEDEPDDRGNAGKEDDDDGHKAYKRRHSEISKD